MRFTCVMHFLGINHVDGVPFLLFWLPYGLLSFTSTVLVIPVFEVGEAVYENEHITIGIHYLMTLLSQSGILGTI